MIKVYMSTICIDCRNLLAVVKARNIAQHFNFISITENTDNLKEFLALRDHDIAFAAKRSKPEDTKIGIPAFIKEDGQIAFEADEAFAWLGEPPVRDDEIVEWK